MVYQQLRRWMEGELGMTFGPKRPPASEPATQETAPERA
jgi:hypothetical protein